MTKRNPHRARLPALKKGQRKRFSIEDKMIACEKIGNGTCSVRAIAREFGIDRTTVQKWRQQLQKAKDICQSVEELESLKSKYTLHPGMKPKSHAIDASLLEFVAHERENGVRVTKAMMIQKYRELMPEDEIRDISQKALNERLRRWMFSNNI